ncbi:MAG: glycosyltransferase family 39 protein [Candidatus Saganbacteria bacterium]|nr:glycosyltransferase family 39 protein [Candidatus Saganbacteria bacterium]
MFKNKNLLALILIIILGIITSTFAYYYLVLPRDVFYWDESHHAFFGLLIYDDIKNHNWGKFWQDTGRQTLWPPIHSWFLGGWLLIFGPGYVSARSFSLLPFLGSLFLLFLIAVQINREKGWFIAVFSCFLLLTAPAFLKQSTACMIESLSVFFSLSFVYIYLLFIDGDNPWKNILIGLSLGVLFLVKYQYSIIFCIVVFVLAIMELLIDKDELKKWFYKYLFLVLGYLSILVLWFITPPVQKKIGMMFYAWNTAAWTHGRDFTLWDKLSYYPGAIFKYYGFSYLIGVLLLTALVYSFWHFRNKQIRVLGLMVLIPLVLSAIIKHQEFRYLSAFIPLLYLLSGFMLINIMMWVKSFSAKQRKMLYVVVLLLLVIMVYDLTKLPSRAADIVYREYSVIKIPGAKQDVSNLEDVLNYFYDAIPPRQSVSWGFQSNFFTPYTLSFHFYDKFASYSPFMIKHPDFFRSNYFITIDIGKDSPYYWEFKFESRLLQLAKWNVFLKQAEKDGKIMLYEEKEFPNLSIMARIYKKNL